MSPSPPGTPAPPPGDPQDPAATVMPPPSTARASIDGGGGPPGTPPEVSDTTVVGVKGIFLRFVLLALALNALLGSAAVIYNVADSIKITREFLANTGTLIADLTRRLRRQSDASDEAVVRQAAAISGVPMALLDHAGALRYASSADLPGLLPRVFPPPAAPGIRYVVKRSFGALSGAWVIRPFTPRHHLLVVVPRDPDEEGVMQYMTIAAGITGLGLLLSLAAMLMAGNWMVRRPLSRLVVQLTRAISADNVRRQRAEERAVAARLEAEEHLAFRDFLLDASEEVGIVATDAAGRVQIFNRAAERILQLSAAEVLGTLTLESLRHLNASRELQRSPRESLPELHPADGEERWVDSRGAAHLLELTRSDIRDAEGKRRGELVTFIDVTERRRLEAELQLNELRLIQSAKMATLGEMATGVAHELNQPLNNIGLLASRLGRRLPQLTDAPAEQDFFREKLARIGEQVERAGGIVSHLRTFGRAEAKRLQAVTVGQAVEEVMLFLREKLLGQGVAVHVDLPANLPPVLADRAQLEQVLMNLLLNAGDALESGRPRAPAGRITLSAGTCALDEVSRGVFLRVCDNGPGVPPEILPRIFDPFFTTKEVGKGTGLGLSISYSLVRGFGGTLEVESLPEQGATFTLRLREAPLAREDQDPARR